MNNSSHKVQIPSDISFLSAGATRPIDRNFIYGGKAVLICGTTQGKAEREHQALRIMKRVQQHYLTAVAECTPLTKFVAVLGRGRQ